MNCRSYAGVRGLIVAALVVILGLAGKAGAQIVGFGGSNETGWTANGNVASLTANVPTVVGFGSQNDVLNLTTASNGEASSYWFNSPQSITNFSESFTYTDSSTNGADGIAAVWQNAGPSALGGGGGSLGFAGIGSSAGLAMNLFSDNGGSGSEFNNTLPTGSVALTPTPGGVNLDSGHPINVVLNYRQADGALTETMTDTITSATFTRVWRGISIQGQVGGTTAYVGFTGSTGGVNAAQSVTNFQFIPGSAPATPVAHITPITATGYNQNMIISALNGGLNMTATMDGGTANTGKSFYEKGAATSATGSGVPLAGVIFGSATDSNHTFALQPDGAGQNDALMLDSTVTSGALVLSGSTRYSMLSFLMSGAGGGGSINVTVNYAGGGTQTALIFAPDWFGNGSIALDANGRGTTALAFDSINSASPRMFQQDLVLNDTQDAVTSISVGWGGTNREVIWGISGAVAVPEPASLGIVVFGVLGLMIRRRGAAQAG